MDKPFRDRAEGGKALADRLRRFAGTDALVLALPRGGVPVAYEVARALGLPLDVLIVRKLGLPGHEEFAIGAIASGGIRVLNEAVLRRLGLTQKAVEAVAEREQAELERREREYRADRLPERIAGRTAIVVDDGLATGQSMLAAVRALRQQRPARIVVAVPVAAEDTCAALRGEADEVICPMTPEPFYAVGAWYEDFSQTSDDEVRALLAQAAVPAATADGAKARA